MWVGLIPLVEGLKEKDRTPWRESKFSQQTVFGLQL